MIPDIAWGDRLTFDAIGIDRTGDWVSRTCQNAPIDNGYER